MSPILPVLATFLFVGVAFPTSAATPLAPPATGAVAAGARHALWLRPDGTVWAWGDNRLGQLGDGTVTMRTTRTRVMGLTSVAAIAASDRGSMALRTDGTVWTWGTIDTGLTEGTEAEAVPAKVPGISGAVSIAAGELTRAVVVKDGSVWIWGALPPLTTTPAKFAGATGMTAVSIGANHVLMLRKDGTVWAFGLNYSGQLGDGTTTDRTALVQVAGLTGVTAIAAMRSSSLALKADGTVVGWGAGERGELGSAVHANQTSPVTVAGLPAMRTLAIPQSAGCPVSGAYGQAMDGRLFRWGGVCYGDPGLNYTPTAPAALPVSKTMTSFAAGLRFAVYLDTDGLPRVWGSGVYGERGDGVANLRLWPVPVAGVAGVKATSSGGSHVLAALSDGTVWGWGDRANTVGLSSGYTSVPEQVAGLSGVIGVAAGWSESYAVKGDGTVWAWGSDLVGSGSLGAGGTYRSTPAAIAGLAGIKSVSAGYGYAAALSSDGSVWTWGFNGAGQLGDSTTVSSATPRAVPGLTDVKKVVTSLSSVLALRNDGTVWLWGRNDGLHADGAANFVTPKQVTGLSQVADIAYIPGRGLALLTDGSVWQWGQGIPPNYSASTVTRVASVPSAKSVFGSFDAVYIVASDGTLWASGVARSGHLGDGRQTDSVEEFVRVVNIPASVTGLDSSDTHVTAVTAEGVLWAWGNVPSAAWVAPANTAIDPKLITSLGEYSANESSAALSSPAGSRAITVSTTTPTSPWTVVSDCYWLSASPSTGTGNATVTMAWQANAATATRTGTLRIGSQIITVTQTGTGSTHSISGTVTRWGKVAVGVPVNLTGPQRMTTVTDATGAYSFAHLNEGGTFTVRPEVTNVVLSPESKTITSIGSNQTVDFDATGDVPTFLVTPGTLNFAATTGGVRTGPQEITVTLTSSASRLWTATADKAWLSLSPIAGSATGKVRVSLVPSALPASGTEKATITFNAPNVDNGTATVTCNLNVTAASTPPYGSFDTPSGVLTNLSGSIPMTGWALDDIGVQSVKIWRDPVGGEPVHSNGYVYIADAVMVPDARPDVENAYPQAPARNLAGWGYMLLSNFLPATNGQPGNGTYRFHAIATDLEGKQGVLGTKTIQVNNKDATKPFGTIDTPAQGATISGSAYVNFGWALTPLPAFIPLDGSTISVGIDGVLIGHPVYNQNRSDIASAFPDYVNSAGAVGYYMLDTTKYANGLHTIGWLVYDNKGRGDGVGSRFFTVFNEASTSVGWAPAQTELLRVARTRRPAAPPVGYPAYRRGFDLEAPLDPVLDGVIELSPADRLEFHLPPQMAGIATEAGMRVAEEVRPLPAGSTFDTEAGIFYWQLAPGFLGDFELEFHTPDRTSKVSARIRVSSTQL